MTDTKGRTNQPVTRNPIILLSLCVASASNMLDDVFSFDELTVRLYVLRYILYNLLSIFCTQKHITVGAWQYLDTVSQTVMYYLFLQSLSPHRD